MRVGPGLGTAASVLAGAAAVAGGAPAFMAIARLAPGAVGMTIARPSSSSRIAYPTSWVRSKTMRVTPFRYWLPRICATGSMPTVRGILRHAYTVSSRSMTRRRGEAISSAWYFGSVEVFTKMLRASGCEVTVTSRRTPWAPAGAAGASRTAARLIATSTVGIRRPAVIYSPLPV